MAVKAREAACEWRAPEGQRAALRALVAAPKFELIPLKNARDAAEALPDGATVTVTASPSHGIESTIELAEHLVGSGHDAVPHLSAHMIRDRAHLGALLDRCRVAGLREAFVVGGDAKDRGEFHDGLALLRAMTSSATRSRRSAYRATRRATSTSPVRDCSRRSSRSSVTPRTWRHRCASTPTRSSRGSPTCVVVG